MPSSSLFRLISTAIPILLLAALVSVIIVAVRDNPSTALPRLTPTSDTLAMQSTATATVAATETATFVEIPVEDPATPAEEEEEATPSADPPTATATPLTDPPTSAPTATPTANGSVFTIPAAATPTPALPRIESPFAGDATPTVRVYTNGNFVNAVALTRSTVWAATNGGVVAWNKTSGGYVKFTAVDGLSANRTVAASVCPLPGLGILFGSAAGLQIFDTQNGSWKTLNPDNSPMRGTDIIALWCDASAARLVVAYARDGLDLFDARNGDWQPLGLDSLTEDTIRDMAVSPDGETLWLATLNGLVALTGGETSRYTVANSPLGDNRIEALAVDGSGAVWLTSGDTLYRTANDEWTAYNGGVRGNFPSGRLTGLDVSGDGAIWIGSDQAQLCRFDPGIEGCVAFYSGDEGMSSAPLTSLTISADGEVFFTTAGGGVSYFDGDTWRLLSIPGEPAPGNAVRSLALDAEGGVWVAANGGAGRIAPNDGGTAQVYTPANSPLPSVDVRVVQPLAGGVVWIGGGGGASLYDGATWTSYSTGDGLAGETVTAVTGDGQNRVWLGTTAGLSIWTGTSFFNLTTANGLPSNEITALTSTGNVVWIGTRGGGLLRFQDNQLQLFNTGNSNLPSNSVTALVIARDGSLYIGTEAGVARFNDNDLRGDAGLGPVAITALAAAPNGEVWAATSLNELYRFDAAEWNLYDAPRRPAAAITALVVDAAGDLWIGGAQGGVARYTP